MGTYFYNTTCHHRTTLYLNYSILKSSILEIRVWAIIYTKNIVPEKQIMILITKVFYVLNESGIFKPIEWWFQNIEV